MKDSILAIGITLLLVTIIGSPIGMIVSALMGQFSWTTAFIISFFGAVAIVVIAGKVMDRQEASA